MTSLRIKLGVSGDISFFHIQIHKVIIASILRLQEIDIIWYGFTLHKYDPTLIVHDIISL